MIDDVDATWLMSQFGRTLCDFELDALIKVLERAEFAPEPLFAFVRTKFADFVGDRAMNGADVVLLRRLIYAGDAAVSDDEAHWLIALDAQTEGRTNDPVWPDLFVKMQLCHLMGRQASAVIDGESVKSRLAFAYAPPQGVWKSISRIWSGGFEGYRSAVKTPSELDALENDYWALNANAAADAELTDAERRWAAYEANADGKLTSNEHALLAELQKFENAR